MKRITVFTPTYNRGYVINNVYESLKNQAFKDFEWLVIDDGSTDDTEQIFQKWLKETNSFVIRYFRVENGGRHRALNKAFDLADGQLFVQINSYERFTDNALQRIDELEKTIADKTSFAGVSGCRGYSETEMIGSMPDRQYIDATSLERRRYAIIGDKAEVYYTSVLKKYKFPEFEEENYIIPSIVWNTIANDGYKIRWFNDIIRIGGYRDDGITRNKTAILLKNPKGYIFYVKCFWEYRCSFINKIRVLGIFTIRTTYQDNSAARELGVNLLVYKLVKLLALCHKIITHKSWQ